MFSSSQFLQDIYRFAVIEAYTSHKNNCQKIQPAQAKITKREFILRGSCFCETFNTYTLHSTLFTTAHCTVYTVPLQELYRTQEPLLNTHSLVVRVRTQELVPGLDDNLLQNLHGFTLLDYAKPFENLQYSRILDNGFLYVTCNKYVALTKILVSSFINCR